MSINHLPLTTNHSPNPNLRWAQIFVEELARSGLQAACLAPGSRSTPLTLAFDAHPAIELFIHLDERSAAFFALGMALATDRPVALVCTSGTAVANFFPALIEAKQSHVPLLLVTADRPPELRHSGANQTIDQVKIYGDQVLWSVDVPLPEANAPAVTLRHLRTLAARAYATADGLLKGPVHLNFPFRKPLEPEGSEQLSVISHQSAGGVAFSRGVLTLAEEQLRELTAVVNQHSRGLIVCGPRCPGGDFPQAVAALSNMSSYPLLADPLSGLRFGEHVRSTFVLGGYDTFLMGQEAPGWNEPEVVIRFGAVPTSKWLNQYLDRIEPAYRIHIRSNGAWADDSHRTTHFVQADETAVCEQLAQSIQQRIGSRWQEQVWETEANFWPALDKALAGDFFDGAVIADVVDLIPAGTTLFMGNSLPIRHLDQFGRPLPKPLHVFANRGASGIDGNISTALGVAAACDAPLVLVVGDITFYHDLNGLLAIRQQGLQRVTIVLLNNNGGGIFHRLPVSAFEPPFTKLFITPHGLDFEPAVRMYGLDYARVEERHAFRELFVASVMGSVPRVIEVRTDGRTDLERRSAVIKNVNRA